MENIKKLKSYYFMTQFIEFIRENNIVGLAIGFIFGNAVLKIVTALMTDIVNPILGIVLGMVGKLDDAYWQIGSAKLLYGDLISVLINFTIVAFIVYFMVRIFRLEKLAKKKE